MDSSNSSVISFDCSSEMTASGMQSEEIDSNNTISAYVDSLENRNSKLEAEIKQLKEAMSKRSNEMSFLHTEEQTLKEEISRFERIFKELKHELIEKKRLEHGSSSYSDMEIHYSEGKAMYQVWQNISEAVKDTVQKAIKHIEPLITVKMAASGNIVEFVEPTKAVASENVDSNAERLACVSNAAQMPEETNEVDNVVPALNLINPITEKLCDDICGTWKRERRPGCTTCHRITIEKLEDGYYRTTAYWRAQSITGNVSLWRPDDVTRDNTHYFQMGNKICQRKLGSTSHTMFQANGGHVLEMSIAHGYGDIENTRYSRIYK